MHFKFLYCLSSICLLSGCSLSTEETATFSCKMLNRTIEDSKAKDEWVELYLPSQFSMDVMKKHFQFWTESIEFQLQIFKRINQQQIAIGEVMLPNSNGDKFPVNYELTFDTNTKEYVLKARPHKLFLFGVQKGVCS